MFANRLQGPLPHPKPARASCRRRIGLQAPCFEPRSAAGSFVTGGAGGGRIMNNRSEPIGDRPYEPFRARQRMEMAHAGRDSVLRSWNQAPELVGGPARELALAL